MCTSRSLKCASAVAAALCVWCAASPAAATERLCDPAYEDCRAPLLAAINGEQAGIDVAFWFMEDSRYSTAIVNRWKAGIPVRVLVDPSANVSTPTNAQILAQLASAGIPMRYRLASAPGILHWKMMLFAGQNTVQFSGANYSDVAFVYHAPYSDYEDENPYFTDDPSVVNSFKTKYDDLWNDTTYYGNYANVTGPLWRVYPNYPKNPELNFPQQEDYAARILKRDAAETQKT
jgi:phosphatidylserine/phosphatidylglycerophosphate/cardiolipin synthase-like enzyme